KLRETPDATHAVLFMPGVFGFGSLARPWARLLEVTADAYSCNLPLTASDQPLDSIEAIARYCRHALIRHEEYLQYTLVGWSFGGVVAHVLARQLAHDGEPPARLILMDSYLPAQDGPRPDEMNDAQLQ